MPHWRSHSCAAWGLLRNGHGPGKEAATLSRLPRCPLTDSRALDTARNPWAHPSGAHGRAVQRHKCARDVGPLMDQAHPKPAKRDAPAPAESARHLPLGQEATPIHDRDPPHDGASIRCREMATAERRFVRAQAYAQPLLFAVTRRGQRNRCQGHPTKNGELLFAGATWGQRNKHPSGCTAGPRRASF